MHMAIEGNRTFLSEVKGFTPVIDILANELGTMTALVYGIVWRYCQQDNHVCYASKETIAKHANISPKTVQRHLHSLVERGYLEDLTPDKRNAPHTYKDAGKVIITGLVEARLAGRSESPTSEVGRTESPTRWDRESYLGGTESPTKRVVSKKEVIKKETIDAAKKPPPTRDPTYLPETDEQLGILFPQTCQGLRDQLDLIQRASWNIRGDDIRSAMAHFLKASGLPIPNDKSTRSQWIKAVRIHVNNFGVGLLEQAYPLALARCKNVTIGWPGALDKTLPAVVRDMQNGGNHAPHSTRRAGPGDGRRQDTTATEQAEWARRLTS